MGCLRLRYEKEYISPLKVVYRENLCVNEKRGWNSNSIDPMEQYHSPYLAMDNLWHLSVDPDGGQAGITPELAYKLGQVDWKNAWDIGLNAGYFGKNLGEVVVWAADVRNLNAFGDGLVKGGKNILDGALNTVTTPRGAVGALFPALEKLVWQKDNMAEMEAFSDRIKNADEQDYYKMAGEFTTQIAASLVFKKAVGMAASGNIPIPKIHKGPGGKINGITISKGGYGAKPRFDVHPLNNPSKKSNSFPDWVKGKTLPHYHRGKGNNLHRHRPWENGWNDKSFFDRF
jgi:hypothetical protein